MSQIRRMDRTGDSVVAEWDVADTTAEGLAAVAAAEQIVRDAHQVGSLVYRLDEPGSGELLREFDPEAGTIVITPRMVGG